MAAGPPIDERPALTQALRITIVGAGFIGRSWATLFAQYGHGVTLHDPAAAMLAAAPDAIIDWLDSLQSAGLLDDPIGDVLARITLEPDLATALGDADYVQENAPERLDVKRALFAQLDRLTPATAILASSSSSLTCSQLCEDLPGRARCVIAHPANPPHLLRAVEIVPAAFTTATTIERAAQILRGIGQVPIVIGEIDGFVMNRLQAALAREALALVAAGIADADAIDSVVKHSLGPRWAFMGPFETMDLNAPDGFADYAARYGVPFARLFGEPCWPQAAVAAVDNTLRACRSLDTLPARREWRDRRLTALLAHLQDQSTR